ncbi:nitrile hydratase subunit alpha [Siccirubricoccus sp. KC 17139]|uniref:Nitrile hydratase subunit alpha n=1 Tax=Siccirubricoccus soli TaxID=2899147 RepID=A0ABT1DDM4_9PROT|nr:nitrile hydratase subunit alpha [Siccirubricoccus soli]MCO6420004.1 nitrile hydratase subunit alpha [Siccirubricoccus soli]MCP2686139.1 nitrile hydratase subunit alpha [Siccirubricoccus soli]
MSAPARPESLAHLEKLLAVLSAKGLITAQELVDRQASTDRASPEIGARMVARAWLDPEWRRLLLANGAEAAERMGVSMAGAPPLGVLEDKPDLHHLVVCTLCSCYPRAVLGYPPSWYKSFEYRSRAVREPRAVLAEWGTQLAPGVKLRVVDSTADFRWMVLPLRPEGTEGWSEDQLAALVTRDALVGVALPRVPQAIAAE